MSKDLITGILVAQDTVSWSILRQNKSERELIADGTMDINQFRSEKELTTEERIFFPPEHGASVVLALSSDKLLLRVMDFPAVDDEDLLGMIELQVDKYSPFPLDQMVISHEILAQGEDGVSVLVAAARAQSVADAAALLEEREVSAIKRVDAAVLGCWKNICASGKLSQDGVEVVVIVDGDVVDVIVHEGGVLKAISCLGAIQGLEDADTAEEVAGEISNLVLSMDIGGMAGSRVAVWCTDLHDRFVGVLQNLCAGEVAVYSLGDLPSATYGVVLRLLEDDTGIDLTLASWREKEANKRDKQRLIGLSLMVLVVWGLVVGGFFGWIQFQKIRLKQLEREDEKWSAPANKVRHLRLQATMIERYTDRTYSALECLREISLLQPEGVDLTSFTYRKGEGVAISGESDTSPLVNKFNEALNKSKLFGSVKPGMRTLTKKGRYRFSFDISFPETKK